MNLTELIKNNYAYFDSYRQGFFYYTIEFEIDEREVHDMGHGSYDLSYKKEEYQFTIPAEDVGNGTLNAKEKAITLMRWIRKAIDSGELIKIK